MPAPRHRVRSLLAVVFAASLVVLAGCGSDDPSTSTTRGTGETVPAATEDAQLAGQVPKEIRDAGTLTVAMDATYPPNEFTDEGGTIIGMDADLAKSLGEVLGLDVRLNNATFDAIIPAIASGRFNLGMSSFTDTKEREREVTFVTYFRAGTGFYTLAQGGTDVGGLADLCGKSVAVERGTVQQDDGEAQSKKCTDAGDPAVNVLTFPDQNGANLAISSGRAELGMADSPVAAYIVEQSNGRFKSVGSVYGDEPYGIAMAKDSGTLPQAVQGALKKLMEGGQYDAILKKWGIEDGAITDPVINGAES